MRRFLTSYGGRPSDATLLDFVSISRRDRTKGWSHGSGWGMLYAKFGEYGLYKSTSPIWESYMHPPNGYIVYILHSRLASVGSISLENTHPILYGGFAVVHNGTIDKKKFAAELKESGVDVRTGGSTDTELLLKGFVELGGDLKALKEISRIAARHLDKEEPLLNFLAFDLNKGILYIVSYREAEDPHFVPVMSESGGMIVVASEPLAGYDKWEPIPNSGIYIFRNNEKFIDKI